MKWFKIRLKDEAVADGAMKTVMDAFEDAMPLGDESRGCALFSRDEPNATVIFVSPQFATVAPRLVERFSGVEGAALGRFAALRFFRDVIKAGVTNPRSRQLKLWSCRQSEGME